MLTEVSCKDIHALCTLTAGDVVFTWIEGDTDKAIHADLACEFVINLLHKWFNDILVRVRLHGSD